MNPKDFKDDICRPFCMFYKEGQKEETACLAAQVAAALIRQKGISLKQFHSAVKNRRLWLKHKTKLTRHVCRQCLFMKSDCDFQSESPSDDLEPCGGYVILAGLLENQVIDTVDLDTS